MRSSVTITSALLGEGACMGDVERLMDAVQTHLLQHFSTWTIRPVQNGYRVEVEASVSAMEILEDVMEEHER